MLLPQPQGKTNTSYVVAIHFFISPNGPNKHSHFKYMEFKYMNLINKVNFWILQLGDLTVLHHLHVTTCNLELSSEQIKTYSEENTFLKCRL